MDTQVYLRSQAELLAELKARVRESGSARWSEVEIYQAINDTLDTWHGLVASPHLYTIPGGWVTGTFTYALPAYIRPPLMPEVERPIPYNHELDVATTHTWQPIAASTEPDGAGGLLLRLHAAPGSLGGRVRFWAANSRVPTTLPTTSGSTSDDATDLVLGSVVDAEDVGYVKVGAEWIAYAGATRGSASTTLHNLLRGLYGTPAAAHDSGASVAWGIAVDDRRLWQQLRDQTQANLYRMQIGDGSVHETSRYEQYMNYYQTRADQFWPTYRAQRPAPQFRPNRRMYQWT